MDDGRKWAVQVLFFGRPLPILQGQNWRVGDANGRRYKIGRAGLISRPSASGFAGAKLASGGRKWKTRENRPCRFYFSRPSAYGFVRAKLASSVRQGKTGEK